MAIEFLEDEEPKKTSKIEFIDEPKMEEQNVIGQTFNVPGAAIRSALMGKGYVEGALNPSAVPKFQDITNRIGAFTGVPIVDTVIGMPISVAGMAADIVTNPAEAIVALAPVLTPVKTLGKAIVGSKAGQLVGKAVTSEITPIKWVKDALTGVKKTEIAAEEAKKAIRSNIAREIDVVKGEGIYKKKILSSLEKKYKEELGNEEIGLSKALESAEKTYAGEISDTAFAKSKEIRKDLPKLFRQKSMEYGEGLNKILLEKPVVATQAEVTPILEDSLMNHGILKIDDTGKIAIGRSPATKAEAQIFAEYSRLRQLPADATINTGELLQSETLIRPKFGKTWGSSEHLQSEVSEGLSGLVSQKSPEVAAYRKAYAPFLEWKKEAIKEFQPFAGKYAKKDGTQILSKYADVNKELTRNEVSLMAELEKQTQKDYTGGLKSIRGLGREIKGRKESASLISKVSGEELKNATAAKKAEIDNIIASRIESLNKKESLNIEDINKETKDIVDALKRRRVIIGAGAFIVGEKSGFFKYILHRLSYGLFGITH